MSGKPWSHADDAELARRYSDESAAVLAEQLGRSIGSIYARAQMLGLGKSPAFYAGWGSGRTRGERGGNTRFKAGQTPWNKGRHYSAGGRSAETRFKKGRPPEQARNYLPVGSLRVNKDGVLERKVSDNPNIAPARRWIVEHRRVWMDFVQGPLAPSLAVIFKPGMRTTNTKAITVDRIECLTRQELMRKNTRWHMPPELNELVTVRTRLTRKINQRSKDHEK